MRTASATLLLSLAIPLFAVGCGEDRIVVASKNFTESAILGELVAQQIERRTDLGATRRFFLGGTFVCHRGLIGGEIDIYVEYTGTALAAVLELPVRADPDAVYDTVSAVYERRFDVIWGEPLGFNNTFAILVRGSDARGLGLETISEAARYTPEWQAGFGYEFMEREDGFEGLAETYALEFARAPRIMDLGLTYRALADSQVDLIAGNSTDGLISALDLVQLKDDKRYFPPYEAAPLIRGEIVRQHPEVKAALDELGELLTDQEMRRLNRAVDVDHRDAAQVVSEWLEEHLPVDED